MYTINKNGLIAEYLFDGIIDQENGDRIIRNTADVPDNEKAPDGVIIDSERFPNGNGLNNQIPSIPLELDANDSGMEHEGSKSLHFNVCREIVNLGLVDLNLSSKKICEELVKQDMPDIENYSQYVNINGFPHLELMTAMCWVKTDYMTANPLSDYPNGNPDGFGFGACPQPLCKAESWYLFSSTARSDRNLILTTLAGITQGIPRENGGVISGGKIPHNEWVHIAFTFGEAPEGSGSNYEMKLFINGIEDVDETPLIDNVGDDPGNNPNFPKLTDEPIVVPNRTDLRIGTFRDTSPCLDYQYSGKISGVRIYNRALSPDEILGNFKHDNGELAGCVQGLINSIFGRN